MSKIKTYGEIQYYLYDGDKKERKVSREHFLGSKDVSVTHYTAKKKQATTTSTTGIVIEKFDDFCNEYNGSNLSIDYNKEYPFDSMQMTKFDGGDGPSGTPDPKPDSEKVKNVKRLKGSTTERTQKAREEKRKEMSKKYREAKMRSVPATDDTNRFSFDMKSIATHTN